MANESELLINVVNANKPKMLTGLHQNGKWSSSKVTTSFAGDIAPPAKRQQPIPTMVLMRNGGRARNLPFGESESQDEPIRLRVQEDGES